MLSILPAKPRVFLMEHDCWAVMLWPGSVPVGFWPTPADAMTWLLTSDLAREVFWKPALDHGSEAVH